MIGYYTRLVSSQFIESTTECPCFYASPNHGNVSLERDLAPVQITDSKYLVNAEMFVFWLIHNQLYCVGKNDIMRCFGESVD